MKELKKMYMQNKYGKTALTKASERGQLEVVNRLLNCKEIDVNVQNKYGMTALTQASRNGHLDVVNRLLECKENEVKMQ